MYYLSILIVVFNIFIYCVDASQVAGYLHNHRNEGISLIGFNGLDMFTLDSDKIGSNGNFMLVFHDDYKGMGFLNIHDSIKYFLVLNEKEINVFGEYHNGALSLNFINSNENRIFQDYAIQHNQRENALSAWKYLRQLYGESDILSNEGNQKLINDEILRIQIDDDKYLIDFDKSLFVSWYLPKRKLLEDMSNSIKRNKEDIPKYIEEFRKIDLDDSKLYHSGLYRDLLIGHFILIENMNLPPDSIEYQTNVSINYVIKNLSKNNLLLNETALYLFNIFEKQGLTKASEYLSLSMLSNESCLLDSNIKNRFEIYRKMNEGKFAPDIDFNGLVIKNGAAFTSASKLSQINSKYKLVVFGAGWCDKCKTEFDFLINVYPKMIAKGIEVIFISLDTDKHIFGEFSKKFPFISYCDFQKWNSRPVIDYYVFATPTFFFLDSNNQILRRPISINHVNMLVDSID